MGDAIIELQSYSPQAVGFDLEWKSTSNHKSKQRKVSLMQICFDKHLIILIRIHLLRRIPLELVSFLNNPCIIKCGVSICNDKAKLFNDYKLSMHGAVDLNDIYAKIESSHCSLFGLNKFSQLMLGSRMKYKDNI